MYSTVDITFVLLGLLGTTHMNVRDEAGMNESMTAAVLVCHGDHDAFEVRRDWPRPTADEGEVVVRVTAAAVNNTDIWTRQGAYGLPGDSGALAGWRGPISFPRIQGGDVAGVVHDVGDGVDPGLVARRVLVDPALYLDDHEDAPPIGVLGSEADGGFADYVTVPARQVHDVADSPLTDEQLACLPVAYGTAMGMLERASVASAETVLVTGASGGVGLALVQLSAARGARVVAVTSEAKADAVRAAGANVIVSRDRADLPRQVEREVPGGLDVVADVAGGPLLAQLMPLVRDDGRWVIAGAVAGPVVSFDLRRLYLHNIALLGSSMHTRRHFTELVEAARFGTITPQIAGRHHLTNIHEAQRQFSAGDVVGKLIITP